MGNSFKNLKVMETCATQTTTGADHGFAIEAHSAKLAFFPKVKS
jgi:hypothetical protein